MGSLNVGFQVAFLGERVGAKRAEMRPFPGVLFHVRLQRVLLVESLEAHEASERLFARVYPEVALHHGRLCEDLFASRARSLYAADLVGLVSRRAGVGRHRLVEADVVSLEQVADTLVHRGQRPVAERTNEGCVHESGLVVLRLLRHNLRYGV